MKKNQVNALGGPTKVVELLGWKDRPGAVQRVSNWNKRGVPSAVRLDFPHVFLDPHQKDRGTSDPARSEAA